MDLDLTDPWWHGYFAGFAVCLGCEFAIAIFRAFRAAWKASKGP